ncbi:SDR family oxidoreductase [Xanthobacter autotrophicus]|uniref:SDR family oxidoreductase n=1 Tax=Xanthobacter autotrophicus TaxID=280 RepID=UPI0024A66773|nr:SDR family oxidoreductase [Xanthobacter autotrophicus]MDI4656670.1 SDR family oxidoreductase [Xanthobacter autotrophicus]
MTALAALGFGYCVRHLVADGTAPFSRIVGTARTAERLAALPAGVAPFLFDGESLSAALAGALAGTELIIASAPPDARGDPVLRCAGQVLEEGRLGQVVYLTTLGVYGDHGGGWVDETTPPRAGSPRLERRLAAEQEWFAFGQKRGIPISVLRLAGIYGPGRNALEQLRAGAARRIDKPGQVFNRIHVADIARTIRAVVARRFDGVLNVTDDLPAPPGDPIAYAAELLGLPVPPAIPFDEAARDMSPMALTFWAANKRVANHRLKAELGVSLAYPTYREGLAALPDTGA